MSSTKFLAPTVFAFVLALVLPGTTTAAIKCWTNKEGNRECGNAVPPEYAQQETRTINTRGITVDVKERAKTAEELEQEKADEQRKADEKKRLEDQQARDRMLLSSYTTEQELIHARDRATGALDATIEITNATAAQLTRKLDENKRRAAGLERAGTPVPNDLKADIEALEKQIADKNAYADAKKQEKEQLIQRYAADLQRFRELKGIRPQQ